MLTNTGRLYELDFDTSGKVAPRQLNSTWHFKHQPQSNFEFVALAAPEDDLIYAFRIENDEMILEVVRGEDMPVRKRFPNPVNPGG